MVCVPVKAVMAAAAVVALVPPLAIGSVPVTPLVKGKPVALVSVADVGVPKAGVTKVGDVAKATTVPEPVVLYEVPQAEPVELGMPTPGYTIEPPPPDELIVWFGHVPVIVTLVPATSAGVAVPVPPFATGSKPVTPVDSGRPVKFVAVPLEGVPSAPPGAT